MQALRAQFDELKAKLGRTDREIFQTVVGHALTTWARMEEQLVLLAAILIPAKTEKAGLILYSIINFSVWLSVIDDLFLLETRFSEFKPRWNKIHARLRRDKDYRDRLAHHAVRLQNDNRRAFSLPSRFDSRQKSRSFAPLTVDEAVAFSGRITAIAEDLHALVEAMTVVVETAQRPSL